MDEQGAADALILRSAAWSDEWRKSWCHDRSLVIGGIVKTGFWIEIFPAVTKNLMRKPKQNQKRAQGAHILPNHTRTGLYPTLRLGRRPGRTRRCCNGLAPRLAGLVTVPQVDGVQLRGPNGSAPDINEGQSWSIMPGSMCRWNRAASA